MTLVKRFWAKVKKNGPNECWLWQASKTSHGYGKIGSGGKYGPSLRAHRVSYEIHYGSIPNGLNVLHTCDNPPCCNPGHLFLGTQSINNWDRAKKGRTKNGDVRGEQNPAAKLTEEQVIQIRNDSRYLQDIADDYGVCPSTVSNIKRMESWIHV